MYQTLSGRLESIDGYKIPRHITTPLMNTNINVLDTWIRYLGKIKAVHSQMKAHNIKLNVTTRAEKQESLPQLICSKE
jgi:hypothetical protein